MNAVFQNMRTQFCGVFHEAFQGYASNRYFTRYCESNRPFICIRVLRQNAGTSEFCEICFSMRFGSG